ncbi:MAG: histidine--tRNA ligase [Puniceicoccales bacterium]|jgi:histidyl-tRNA synthetase|nr:histidine--tRNA ligase [Puniceicoccales bacterium]
MPRFQTLPGFRDFYPEDCASRNFIFDRCRRTAEAFGFEEYDSPIVEPVELFTAKSGDGIVSQLFNFEDKGGRKISLRPELTPSLARMVGSKASSMRKPIKWFSIGEQFRYERPQKGRLRSFYQFNADVFGVSEIGADAEIIALAVQTLRNFGLGKDDFHVRLSDRGMWVLLLGAFGLDGDGMRAILEVVDRIDGDGEEKSMEAIGEICPSNCERIFGEIKKLRGARSPWEFREQCGVPMDSDDFSRVAQNFQALLDRIGALGLSDFVTVDFGIVRGLAYYTGLVFEIFERSGQSRALAGGGRYDNLVKKLGYADLPAVGFALGDVTLGNLLMEKNLLPKFSKSTRCFVVYTEKMEAVAMGQAMRFRENGIGVEYDLSGETLSKQLSLASRSGAECAAIFGENEVGAGCVKLKNMASGDEKLVKIADLMEEFLKNGRK